MTHPSNKVNHENLEEIFTYHNEEWKIEHYKEIRAYAKLLALAILSNTPDCADRAAALRKLREAVMTANAAVALSKEPWYELP
jgi:hypothetical protein